MNYLNLFNILEQSYKYIYKYSFYIVNTLKRKQTSLDLHLEYPCFYLELRDFNSKIRQTLNIDIHFITAAFITFGAIAFVAFRTF